MMGESPIPDSAQDRVLILAHGRDGPLTGQMLADAGISSATCAGMEALCREIELGCGAVVVAAEALTMRSVPCLDELIRAQPPWSDLPILVVTHAELGRGGQLRTLAVLGNVTVLQRPIDRDVLLSAVQTALRARRRQYEVRDLVQQLEEAARRKDEFLAMLAHELRNPLAPILHAIEILNRAASPDPREMRAREIIQRQVRQQARLLDDLLDVSRISRGLITLHPEPLELVALVQNAVEDHRAVLEGAGLTLETELPGHPIWVEADPTRLAQVVSNLLSNAAKFTERGGRVSVRLGVERLSEAPRRHGDTEREREELVPPRAVLTVRDTGDGIEPAMLPRIFDMFVQADRSLDRRRSGLGLGLALVKGLTELHGGSVEAHSEGPGQGARFTVWLPTVGSPGDAAPRSPAAAAPPRPVRVLVVEDNRDAAETLQAVLELTGCTVAVAFSGAEAVQTAPRFRPDLVLCDIGLPGMSGYEVAEQLSRSPDDGCPPARPRLVALSGYGQQEDRERAYHAGFVQHLTKPVSFDALQQLIEETAAAVGAPDRFPSEQPVDRPGPRGQRPAATHAESRRPEEGR